MEGFNAVDCMLVKIWICGSDPVELMLMEIQIKGFDALSLLIKIWIREIYLVDGLQNMTVGRVGLGLRGGPGNTA